MTSPRCGQCRDRGIGAADAAAADRDQQIAGSPSSALRNRCGIAPVGLDADDIGAGGARALSDQIAPSPCAAGNIDDAQPRPAHISLSSPAARAIRRSRASTRRPGSRDQRPVGNVAARCAERPAPGSPPPAPERSGPTDRPRSQSITQSQPSGMASPASTQTGDVASGSGEYDDAPTRSSARSAQPSRGGDVARRKRLQRRRPAAMHAQRSCERQFDRRHRRDARAARRQRAVSSGVSEAGKRWDVTMAPRMYPIARQIYSRLVALSGP